jgi:hypothetical protein
MGRKYLELKNRAGRRAGTTTYIFTYIRGAEDRKRAELQWNSWWRRRESNPGPEVLPAGFYVRVRRT